MSPVTALRPLARRLPYHWRQWVKDACWRVRSGQPMPRWSWAIGVYEGRSVTALAPIEGVSQPVLSALDVPGRRAEFVADPFWVLHQGRHYLFFELFARRTGRGVIALATSGDGLRWRYRGVVLSEGFHLSYPQVFRADGQWWCVPETADQHSVRLYRAERFPTGWRLHAELLTGESFKDATLFCHDRRWWMLADTDPHLWGGTLRLYMAEQLAGPWREHPASPVVAGDAQYARPAGRVVAGDEGLLRFAQDGRRAYGTAVYACRIDTLTPTAYRETRLPEPVLAPGGHGWNATGMHHIDARRQPDGAWRAVVDGRATQGLG